MLVDSHCHLDFPELSARINQVLDLMQDNGVGCAVCIAVNLEDLPRVLALAEAWPLLLASVGVHPEATEVREPTVAELVELARHPRVIAIGETGLDYYWHKDAPEWQRERFRTHIRAARQAQKPLVVHTREAAADTLRLMQEEGAGEAGGVMHCFTETWEVAEAALDRGFYISLSGIVTFQKASALTLLRAIGAPARTLVVSLLIQVVIVMGIGSLVAFGLYAAALQGVQNLGVRVEVTPAVVTSAVVLAPFLYTQIAFATLLGWLVFNHVPDALAWAGIAVIAASGVANALLSAHEMAKVPVQR